MNELVNATLHHRIEITANREKQPDFAFIVISSVNREETKPSF